MTQQRKVRGPSPARRKAPVPSDATEMQRLTLTMAPADMEALQRVSDANLRSASAQALFYLRNAMAREMKEQQVAEA